MFKPKQIVTVLRMPWAWFKKKSPLLSFIVGRLITMFALLFFLGFALFALMELAPGDIVDQMMSQQIMSGTDGAQKGQSSSQSAGNEIMNETQEAKPSFMFNILNGLKGLWFIMIWEKVLFRKRLFLF